MEEQINTESEVTGRRCSECDSGVQEYTYGGEFGLCASCAIGVGYECRVCGVKKVDEFGLLRKKLTCWECEKRYRQSSRIYRLKKLFWLQMKSWPLLRYPTYRKFYLLFNDPKFENSYLGCNILGYPQRYEDCLCSPKNSLAFAETGGDYVHFSVLFVNGRSYDENPIMVTYPMHGLNQNEGYLILAENLHQFVTMGVKFGFCIFEDMAVDCEKAIKQIENDKVETDFDDEGKALLSEMMEKFGEFNFAGIREHITLVNKKYRQYL